MAKPKHDVVIVKSVSVGALRIYCSNHAQQASEIKSIEGVNLVGIYDDCLYAYVDPRYDLDEVTAEVENMLAPVEIPEAFLAS
jgi:hypothetical protein